MVQTGIASLFFAALLTLMLVCAMPMVSATGPGVSIESDSINTTDFETFEMTSLN